MKVTQGEYYRKANDLPTRNDQLRRAIADAAATTDSWEAFTEKLGSAYTYPVSPVPPIPPQERRQLWESSKALGKSFWAWDHELRGSLKQQLNEAFQKLKTCKTKYHKAAVRETIAQLKRDQAKERLFRQTWQIYAKAASLALRSQNRDDALLCLQKLQELDDLRRGCWREGWDIEAHSHSLLGGTVKSKADWKHLPDSELDIAESIFRAVREEAQRREVLSQEVREAPMPVEVKLTRGVISFRHPDSEYWIRGARLGEAFTLPALGIEAPASRTQDRSRRRYTQEYTR